jgi:hypothetical protein
MTDRPIIFSAPMVRALLDGRKTQTRRIIKGVARDNCMTIKKPTKTQCGVRTHVIDAGKHGLLPFAVGDRLWVRESIERANGEAVGYPADGTWLPNTPWPWERASRPSIHMPRWASRLTLIVTNVRVQRLQDMSEDDAFAEGLEKLDKTIERGKVVPSGPWAANEGWGSDDENSYSAHGWDHPRMVFADLWDSLNAERGYGWETNPWIAAVTFEVHHQNIDAMPTAQAA